LAKISKLLPIAPGDVVQPYALFANSHDGSMAIHIKLTTIRVVCQNTLAIALKEQRFGQGFRRSHHGTFQMHAEAARAFFAATITELDHVAENFVRLSKTKCSEDQFKTILDALLPEPRRPRNVDANPGLRKAWEAT
jgi:hypothetical protein